MVSDWSEYVFFLAWYSDSEYGLLLYKIWIRNQNGTLSASRFYREVNAARGLMVRQLVGAAFPLRYFPRLLLESMLLRLSVSYNETNKKKEAVFLSSDVMVRGSEAIDNTERNKFNHF